MTNAGSGCLSGWIDPDRGERPERADFKVSVPSAGLPSVGWVVQSAAVSYTPLDSIASNRAVSGPLILVYFAKAGEEFGGNVSLGWNPYERGQAMLALDIYENYCGLQFFETNDPAQANFHLVVTTSIDASGTLGTFEFPSILFGAQVGTFARSGSGWDEQGGGGLEPGGLGFATLLHEFGHGLGLAHPHDDAGASTIMLNVTAPFDSYGSYDLNQGIFTTMTYNDGWQTRPGAAAANDAILQGTPMALDIAVLQQKYGAPAANSSDTLYAFGSGAAGGAAFRCIYDTGGTDAISFAGLVDCVIDLTAATLDYSYTGGGGLSYSLGSFGGFTIANGTVIENAIGGGGNDLLVGNDAANELDGGAGQDRLYGGKGSDRFVVDRQDDLVFESAGEGVDTVISSADFYLYSGIENLEIKPGAGNRFGVGNGLDNLISGNEGENLLLGGDGADTISGGSARDLIFGESGADVIHGDDGIDYIVGGDGDDTIRGSADADEVYGSEGNDTLIGGDDFATDILVGGDGNDIVRGDSGLGDYDLMYGNLGNDIFHVDTPADLVFEQPGEGSDTVIAAITGAGYYLYDGIETLILQGSTPFGVGNSLDNLLLGSDEANWLLGGAGNDVLAGGKGNDVLFGEAGADVFEFAHGTGIDTIGDFTPGTDRIRLLGMETSFAALQPKLVQVGGDVAVYLASGDILILQNVTLGALSAADFGFAGGNYSTANTLFARLADLNYRLPQWYSLPITIGDTPGNDTITGTDGAERIGGNAGDDTIYGLAGDDYLEGGNDHDTLYGGEGHDFLDAGRQQDTVYGGPGDDYYLIYGNEALNQDVLVETPGEGFDWVRSSQDAYALPPGLEGLLLHIDGGGGFAYDGFGNELDNVVVGQSLDNTIGGAGGDDLLLGGEGDDRLFGDDGHDWLEGGAGNDLLSGDQGNDVLIGGAGADTFAFYFALSDRQTGDNMIVDFTPGVDKIQLALNYTSFAQLAPLLSQDGSSAVISLAAGGSIVLQGVTVGQLSASDFLFG